MEVGYIGNTTGNSGNVFIIEGDNCIPIYDVPGESLAPFVEDLKVMLYKKDDAESIRFLKKAIKHENKGSIEELIDFSRNAAYAHIKLKGNAIDSMNYATAGITLEKRFSTGKVMKVEYGRCVEIARESGMTLDYAIRFGIRIAVKKDLKKAGKIIANYHGMRSQVAEAFGRIYNIAARKHGLEESTRIFVPAYFTTIMMSNRLGVKRINLDEIAMHVDPAVELFKNNKDYWQYFDQIISNAIYAAKRNITRTPNESFIFAKKSIDIAKNKCNINRWIACVEYFVESNIGLENAMKLSGELEKCSNCGESTVKVMYYLNLQAGTGITEKEAVENCMKILNDRK